MILLLLRTGMRISELLALEPKDIDIKQRKILIMRESKTEMGRVAYISDDALVALKKMAQMQRKKEAILVLFVESRENDLLHSQINFQRLFEEKLLNKERLYTPLPPHRLWAVTIPYPRILSLKKEDSISQD